LTAFAKEEGLAASQLTGIGALSRCTLGYFDWPKKKYLEIPVHEQVEILSLIGDITLKENGEPEIHAHMVLGKVDGTAHGGHLIEAIVRPTLELIIVESPLHLHRKFDPESGLALIRP
jgi:hypothetical protein